MKNMSLSPHRTQYNSITPPAQVHMHAMDAMHIPLTNSQYIIKILFLAKS